MQIPVVAGVGRGRTPLSAFDDALRDCGVLNYNLIRLSSVIPPGTTVVELDRACAPVDEHGDRLYVVMAELRSAAAGRGIAAGIGWFQWGDGRGVFVEHEAEMASTVEAEAAVLDQVHSSLGDLCRARGVRFDGRAVEVRLVSAEVGVEPAAVLVLAVYGGQRW
jgi:arginine decarboxylase